MIKLICTIITCLMFSSMAYADGGYRLEFNNNDEDRYIIHEFDQRIADGTLDDKIREIDFGLFNYTIGDRFVKVYPNIIGDNLILGVGEIRQNPLAYKRGGSEEFFMVGIQFYF